MERFDRLKFLWGLEPAAGAHELCVDIEQLFNIIYRKTAEEIFAVLNEKISKIIHKGQSIVALC